MEINKEDFVVLMSFKNEYLSYSKQLETLHNKYEEFIKKITLVTDLKIGEVVTVKDCGKFIKGIIREYYLIDHDQFFNEKANIKTTKYRIGYVVGRMTKKGKIHGRFNIGFYPIIRDNIIKEGEIKEVDDGTR